MRRAVVTALTLLAHGCAPAPSAAPPTAKCVDDGDRAAWEVSVLGTDATACALGQSMHSATLAALKLPAPACTRDDDCVARSAELDCRGIVRIDLCDEVMHRDAAAHWN